MGSKLHVAFLWHMHQPCYKNLENNQYYLPWVRLHGIKSYYDMAKIVDEIEGIRVTFNFVPSLLEQISDYATGKGNDIYLEHTLKDPAYLTHEEKIFILTNFFHAHTENMVRAYPRYAELDILRGDVRKVSERVDQFTRQDFLDLQVWFNLTWFGQLVKDKDEEIREFIHKGRGFSQRDKEIILIKQQEILKEVVPMYQRLMETGKIELTTSPFYHPILPLLCDTDEAKNCMPGAPLPMLRFSFPEDAERQIIDGISYHEKIFGCRPLGMWPPEGSVSNSVLNLMIKHNILWTATDENILVNTLRENNQSIQGREFLYQPYLYESSEGQITIFFRDHMISDLIGFVYHRWYTPDAIGDFLHRLISLKRELPSDRPNLICIILDGENAWEHYYKQGYDFLTGIYRGLTEHPELEIVTFSEYLWRFNSGDKIRNIFPGSWINADYGTWIGQPAKNLAWDYLTFTRRILEENKEKNDHYKKELAWSEMQIAEGSDWFWWFGDTHSSALDAEFDALFRDHLKNVYKALDCEPPSYLNQPVVREMDQYHQEPKEFVKPVIDGQITSLGEWESAGEYSFTKGSGAMQRSLYLLEKLYYGFDQCNFYLRLEGEGCLALQEKKNELENLYGKHWQLEIALIRENSMIIRVSSETHDFNKEMKIELVAWPEGKVLEQLQTYDLDKVLEIAIPMDKLGMREKEQFGLQIIIKTEKGEFERWPVHEPLQIQVPKQL